MGFFESRVPVDIKKYDDIIKRLRFLQKLGFKHVILEPVNSIEKFPKNLKKKIRDSIELNIHFRINIKPKNIMELKQIIKKYDNFSDILSVESGNKEVQIFCARDTRVDVLSFSYPHLTKTLTPGVLSLSKQYNSFIEFSFSPIFNENKYIQSKNIRIIYNSLRMTLAKKAYYFISGNFSDLLDYRSPIVLISICQTLIDMKPSSAKLALRDNPLKLIDKLNSKRNPNIIEDGVRIIEPKKRRKNNLEI